MLSAGPLDDLGVVGKSTRTSFFNMMTNLDYAGVSYTSPITKRTTGP